MAYGVRLHCWGDFALFTRPEMKVERVSYDVITPSAAVGVLSAIYWKPQIRWVTDKLHVLKPIRFTSQRRNEVGAKIPEGAARKAMKDGRGNIGLYIEEERQQRAALLLRDVGYVIEAHFDVISGEENVAKHLDQFNRRARAGQCFTRPYLGTRECAADFALIEPGAALPGKDQSLIDGKERDLGWMLHEIAYDPPSGGRSAKVIGPRFFHAKMTDGVIVVPTTDSAEVRG